MISKYQFENFIEAMREFKGYVSHFEYKENIQEGGYIDNLYYLILESFIDATIHEMTYGLFELLENSEILQENKIYDKDYTVFSVLNNYINYNYIYIPIIKVIENENEPEIDIEDEAILLNNIDDFYNCWINFKYPENKIYKNWYFSSEDSKKIANKYIDYVNKYYSIRNTFII